MGVDFSGVVAIGYDTSTPKGKEFLLKTFRQDSELEDYSDEELLECPEEYLSDLDFQPFNGYDSREDGVLGKIIMKSDSYNYKSISPEHFSLKQEEAVSELTERFGIAPRIFCISYVW